MVLLERSDGLGGEGLGRTLESFLVISASADRTVMRAHIPHLEALEVVVVAQIIGAGESYDLRGQVVKTNDAFLLEELRGGMVDC